MAGELEDLAVAIEVADMKGQSETEGASLSVRPWSMPRCRAPCLCHLVQHIKRTGLLRLAAEIFTDIPPYVRLADVRYLTQH
jgi:hypothetical protein